MMRKYPFKQSIHESMAPSSKRILESEDRAALLPAAAHRFKHPASTILPSTHSIHLLDDNEVDEQPPSDDLPVIGSRSSQSYVVPSPTPSDDLLLFKSPKILLSGPGFDSPIIRSEDDIPIASSSRHSKLDSHLGLTPGRALPLSSQSPGTKSASPLSSSLSSLGDNDHQSQSPIEHPKEATNTLLEELQQHESSRYSLRERNVRQLKPYAYDRQLYVRQMRSNPDAIVKFRSPHGRKHGDGPRSPRASSDDDVNPEDLDLDVSDEGRPRRRAMSITASDVVSSYKRAGSAPIAAASTTLPKNRDRHRMPMSPRAPDVPAAPEPERNIAKEWYQAKLRELSSSESENDLDLSALRRSRATGIAKGEMHQRRKKRFPMNLTRHNRSPVRSSVCNCSYVSIVRD